MAENSINALTLEVTSSTESAEKAVDKLIGTLEKLHNATANLGLGNIGTQLKGIQKASSGFGEKEASNLDRLFSTLSKLQGVSGIKISSSIANQIVNIGTAAELVQDVNFSGIDNLVTSLDKLSGVGKANIGSTLTQLGRIPEISDKLNQADLGKFAAEIKEVTAAIKPLATEMEKVSKGFSAFPEKIQRLVKETEKVPPANKKAAESYTFLALKAGVALTALRRISAQIVEWITMAGEQAENANLFSVAMGQYADEAKRYAESVSAVAGLDPSDWMRNQGVFMTLATGFGVAGDSASKMSQNLVQLGYDLSSFYNIPVAEAMQKIQSGLAGEIEPMRQLGYDLSYTKLQQLAYANGIDKTVTSMTQAEKAALRYQAIMTQVTQTHGDLARTMDSPMNQLRLLKAAFTEAARAVGNLFIPILQIVIPWAIAAAKAVTRFANAIASFFGIETSFSEATFENVIGGAEDAGASIDSATGSAAKFKKMLLGIDELNVMSEPAGGGGGGSGGVGGGIGAGFDVGDIGNIWENLSFDDMAIPEVGDVVDRLLEFASGVSTVLAVLGKLKMGGALKIITGIGEIVDGISSIVAEGPNFDNVTTVISGLVNVATGIALLTGNVKLAGAGMVLHGLLTAIREIVPNWEAIKNGDWSGVDKVTLFVSALEILGGVILAFDLLTKVTGFMKIGNNAKKVATSTKDISTETGKLATNLKSLAANLGWGLLIITEVAAAAALVTGAVALLGYELQLVDTAWQPVIENGGRVAIAMASGVALMAVIGTVCYGLGTVGATAALNIGIGIAVLAEIGIAAGLLIAEIWAIGTGLDAVGRAWQPVIDNGESIAIAIGVGVGLLVGVAAATAALGAASVASAGALPLAIGIGTAVLAEMTVAVILLTDELTAVADHLNNKLHPALTRTNQILPSLSEGMDSFVGFMVEFAGHVVVYSGASSVAGLASAVDTIVGIFAKDPIDALAQDVGEVGEQAGRLNTKLTAVNPELKTACDMMADFQSLTSKLNNLLKTDVTLESDMTVKMTTVGKNLVAGLVKGINSGRSEFSAVLVSMSKDVDEKFFNPTNKGFTNLFTSQKTAWKQNGQMIVSSFTSTVPSVTSGFFSPMKSKTDNLSSGIADSFDEASISIVNAFKYASKQSKASFKDFDDWFDSRVANPIEKFLKSINTQISSVAKNVKSLWNSITSGKTASITLNASATNVKAYASGGLPSVGEMFVARERGPELVGRIGNQSAVANNNQIIAGIKQGVYEAMMASNGGGGSLNVNVYLSGKQVMATVAEEARRETVRTGVNPLTQGG